MGKAKRIEECCEHALLAWNPPRDCPDCGRSLAGLDSWADQLNKELRARPTRNDTDAYDRDDAYYGGDE